MLSKKKLLELVDGDQVVAAIGRAEALTSGEICVSIAPFFWGSVDRAARRAFTALGVDRTRDRNGVLLFLVPSRRRLVIRGDEGIHDRVGDHFWERVADLVADRFAANDFTGGLLLAIENVGVELARHFPPTEHPRIEQLPNDVRLWPAGSR